MQTIQMHFSQKHNIFSEFFSKFFKAALTFEKFQKEDHPHSLCISEITETERGG